MNNQLLIFYQFLKRDFYVYRRSWRALAINYIVLEPGLIALTFGYLFASVMLQQPPRAVTHFVLGLSIWPLFLLAWTLNMSFLFDLESKRFINYQMTVLKPHVVLLEKILFTSLVSLCNILFFYPVVKLILLARFETTHTSWPKVLLVFACGSLFCSVFAIFFIAFTKDLASVGNLFIRINVPLIELGGAFIPWHIVKGYSPVLGKLLYLNPMLYITEGLRQAMLGGQQFFPIWLSVGGLLIFSSIFTIISCRLFKKKLDHI